MNNIKCRILTTNSQLTSKEGDMIVIPTKDGELGVMFDHVQIVVEVVPGEIRVYNNQKVTQTINVSEGVAYIQSNSIEIFN